MSRPLRALSTRRVVLVSGGVVLAYALVQLSTAVVLGVTSAALVLVGGWTLPGALAVTLPLGVPMVLAQGAALAAVAAWWQARRTAPAA